MFSQAGLVDDVKLAMDGMQPGPIKLVLFLVSFKSIKFYKQEVAVI